MNDSSMQFKSVSSELSMIWIIVTAILFIILLIIKFRHKIKGCSIQSISKASRKHCLSCVATWGNARLMQIEIENDVLYVYSDSNGSIQLNVNNKSFSYNHEAMISASGVPEISK
jgi:hypothetical protein